MTFKCRPVPEDFAIRARQMSRLAMARHYKTRPATVSRWAIEAGLPARLGAHYEARKVPDDFTTFAAVETTEELIRRYRCTASTVVRWRREAQISRHTVPDGFRLVAPTMTNKELRVRYGKCWETIRRWCRECGVEPRRADPAASSARRILVITETKRDTTCAGQAADFLRHYGAVIRCDAAGKFNPKGDYWRRGSSILGADEIIARATRLGWNPDAWREVRAA